MKRILFFSGSRADFGLLYPLIKEFTNSKKIRSYTYLGGHHFLKRYGYTFDQVKKFKINNLIKSKIKLKNTSEKEILDYISKLLIECRDLLLKIKPDLVIILGDRYELKSIVLSSFILKIPILHLHGGELTHGAFDDTIRHAITKYSNFHFVSHNRYKKRLIQLGEQPKNIFNFGSIGAEISQKIKLIDFSKLKEKYKLKRKKFLLITFHPETNDLKNSKVYLNNLFKALKKIKDFKFIFTGNNSDPQGDVFIRKIYNFCKKRNDSSMIYNLGSKEYFSLAKEAFAVVGNSSSGIIEIPSLKTATINIGRRQNGRILSNSILNSNGSVSDFLKKINFLKRNRIRYNNVYYKFNTIKKMKEKIIHLSKINKKEKIFYDIKK